jgi:hypothetical protein
MVLIPLVWVQTLIFNTSSPLTKKRFSLHQIKSAADYILFKGHCARLDLFLYKKTSSRANSKQNKERVWAVLVVKTKLEALFALG